MKVIVYHLHFGNGDTREQQFKINLPSPAKKKNHYIKPQLNFPPMLSEMVLRPLQ